MSVYFNQCLQLLASKIVILNAVSHHERCNVAPTIIAPLLKLRRHLLWCSLQLIFVGVRLGGVFCKEILHHSTEFGGVQIGELGHWVVVLNDIVCLCLGVIILVFDLGGGRFADSDANMTVTGLCCLLCH